MMKTGVLQTTHGVHNFSYPDDIKLEIKMNNETVTITDEAFPDSPVAIVNREHFVAWVFGNSVKEK